MGEVWPEAGAAPGAFREPVSSHNSVQIWARSRAGEQTCSTRDDEASGELFTEGSGVPRVMCSLGMSCGGHFVHPSAPSQARQQWGPGKLKPGMGPAQATGWEVMVHQRRREARRRWGSGWQWWNGSATHC